MGSLGGCAVQATSFPCCTWTVGDTVVLWEARLQFAIRLDLF